MLPHVFIYIVESENCSATTTSSPRVYYLLKFSSTYEGFCSTPFFSYSFSNIFTNGKFLLSPSLRHCSNIFSTIRLYLFFFNSPFTYLQSYSTLNSKLDGFCHLSMNSTLLVLDMPDKFMFKY